MFFYIIVFLISIILSYFSVKIKDKRISMIFKILTILFMTCIAGFRYGIGTDYNKVYEPYFNELSNGLDVARMRKFEIGYVLLNKFVIMLGGSFTWVCIITAFITNYFIYKGLENFKEKCSLPFGILLYMLLYYQKSFNLVRQMISVAIIFYAIKYLLSGDKKKFIIWVLIASLFQRTVLVMIIIPFVQKLYENRKYRFIQIISFVLLTVGILNFSKIGVFVDSMNMEYYSYYFKENESTGITINYFIRILPVIALSVFLFKEILNNKKILLMYNLFLFGAILLLLGYVTSTYGERIAIYFLVYQIVLIPIFIRSILSQKAKFYKYPLILIVIGLNIFLWYNDFIFKGREETVPYVSIFNRIQ